MERLNGISYIDKRKNSLSLNGQWEFDYFDKDKSEIKECRYKANLPSSVFYCVEKAGILPSPYFSLNSKLYSWVDEKIWLFKKEIFIGKERDKGCAVLCLDGAGYYSEIFVNGNCIGCHEGLFGGPYVDIQDYINYGENNVIEVVLKASDKANLEREDHRKMKQYREIMPWGINHCSWSGNATGDFIMFGIWRDVRIEFYGKEHIARPFIYTESIKNGKAKLKFQCDFMNERVDELVSWHNFNEGSLDFSIMEGYPAEFYTKKLFIGISVKDKSTGATVYSARFPVKLNDRGTCPFLNDKHPPMVISKSFSVENVRLWQFEQDKDASLYAADVSLYKSDVLTDRISFDFGIRKIEQDYTSAVKFFEPQDKYLFTVNGKKKFIKGINWCPDDILYRFDENKIEWLLDCVKSAGIEFLRVWNGGNQFESDAFYKLCDKKGIIVWQDTLHANAYYSTMDWPEDVVESQVAVNVQRLRSHPSLAVWCGGNELNYYQKNILKNLSLERFIIGEFDSTRRYYPTTPYGGSVHIYKDFDPTWFLKVYKEAQFVTESGISGFANYKNFRKYFAEKSKLDSLKIKNGKFEEFDEFTDKYPTSDAGDIPTNLTRIEFFARTEGLYLKDVMSLSNIYALHFYKYLIEGMRSQFPKTGGVVPWTLNRSFMSCAGYMCIDADGEPTAQYYAVKKAYEPLLLALKLRKTLYSVGEEIVLPAVIINEYGQKKSLRATVVVYSSCGKELFRESKDVHSEKYLTKFSFAPFLCSDEVRNTFMTAIVRLTENGKVVYGNYYWVKCTDKLLDKGVKRKYESGFLPVKNLLDDVKYYDIFNNTDGILGCKRLSCVKTENGYNVLLSFRNDGDCPIYPITIQEQETPFLRCSDNYFELLPQEEKQVSCVIRNAEAPNLVISAWNIEEFTIKIKG